VWATEKRCLCSNNSMSKSRNGSIYGELGAELNFSPTFSEAAGVVSTARIEQYICSFQACLFYVLAGGTHAIPFQHPAECLQLSPHYSRRILLQPSIRHYDKPDGGRARRSVGQHTVSSMPSSLAAPRARLAGVSTVSSRTLVNNVGYLPESLIRI
jgi:hypothetical protein